MPPRPPFPLHSLQHPAFRGADRPLSERLADEAVVDAPNSDPPPGRSSARWNELGIPREEDVRLLSGNQIELVEPRMTPGTGRTGAVGEK